MKNETKGMEIMEIKNRETNAEFIEERYALSLERITEISKEAFENKDFEEYFHTVAGFVLMVDENKRFLEEGGLKNATLAQLGERNHALYEDILPENYQKSFADPDYASSRLGEELGSFMCFLYTELRSMISFCYCDETEELVIRMELFLEIYGAFDTAMKEEHKLPAKDSIHDILYWFFSDYSDRSAIMQIRKMTIPYEAHCIKVLEEMDPSDLRGLYAYGEYIGDNELEVAAFLAGLPEETINLMADTYTEGYRIGFELANRDLSKKKTVHVIYPIGFERMVKKALENFAKLGLKPVGGDGKASALHQFSRLCECANSVAPNRQYLFDHKDDKALFWDKGLVERSLEVVHTAFEECKQAAWEYAGPAVIEVFGENDFDPVNKSSAVRMNASQNDLQIDFVSRLRQMQTGYILEEERSFTIIAFPIPEIKNVLPEHTMECYGRFFEEVIRINTLDYSTYRDVQTTIIDALNNACFCEIKGMNGNRTDLRIELQKTTDPEKEAIFENCVADVNIPLGEVFTTPMLKGTNGTLHVTRVFLEGLEYKDLTIDFKDGYVSDYNCSNFQTEKENKDFILENVLFRHKTLPIGEFAIGTNTTAYMVSGKYGVQAKLPILIAEKTGPHFAVGDTCYSHSEEIRVFNPDGKEIIAKDNEVSLLRKTDPGKAYFNCHTDITIPYNELGELTAVSQDGTEICIIRQGRFVLPGTEMLNIPLDAK